jgi:hypothetical protein
MRPTKCRRSTVSLDAFAPLANWLAMENKELARARRLAIDVARRIVDGRCSPYEGALRMVTDVTPRFDGHAEGDRVHRVFAGDVRDWDHRPEARSRIEEDIRREAWQFIADWV